MRHTSEIICAGFDVEFGVIKTCAPSVKASPFEASESLLDSENEDPSAVEELTLTGPIEEGDAERGDDDSLLGWDEAGDPEAGDEFSSSGWDVADDDDAEIEDKLSLSGWDDAYDPGAGDEFSSSGWDWAVDVGELSLSCWDNATLM